jgi:acyl-CoA synthetase (AMP-forming)/AMP-acid ligase II
MNLYEYFNERVRIHPDHLATKRFGASDLTYTQLAKRSEQMAAWLASQGIGESDHIAVYLPDSPAYVPTVLGCWHRGAIVTPLNTRLQSDELEYVLNDVQAEVLLWSSDFEAEVNSLLPEVDTIDTHQRVHTDGRLDKAMTDVTADLPTVTKRLDDETAVIMYTSGTTGKPKGVVQTHRNIKAFIDAGAKHFGFTPSDTSLSTIPMYAVGGLHGLALIPLMTGGAMAVQPSWDPVDWVQHVEEAEATISALQAAMVTDVLRTEETREYDCSSLRRCLFGGSSTPESLLKEFKEIFDVPDLIHGYGQTENAGTSVTHDAGEPRRKGSIGRPVCTVEANVVDLDTGEPVQEGIHGELLLRGDNIVSEYWNNPDLNKESFSDGWLHTDDIVYADADGYLYYVDRVDDVIMSGGEKVAPTDVENILQEMPGVESVAIFGTPHDRLGETVSAAVVRSADIDASDVMEFCEQRDDLAGYKKPRRIVFVDEFPRTGSQKIDKVELADRVSEQFDGTETSG